MLFSHFDEINLESGAAAGDRANGGLIRGPFYGAPLCYEYWIYSVGCFPAPVLIQIHVERWKTDEKGYTDQVLNSFYVLVKINQREYRPDLSDGTK